MQSISLPEAIRQQNQQRGRLIDVREPAEFRDAHLPGAVNLPSTQYDPEDYLSLNSPAIYLICQSGDRAKTIAKKLEADAPMEVFVVKEHMESITTQQTSTGWNVDRQFRLLLGILIAIFLIGYSFASPYFLGIPIILSLGLIITAIIDKCYLRVGIARLPWNQKERHLY